MAVNAFDQLVEACYQAETWPLNLIRKKHLNRVLDHYRTRLLGDDKRLFVESGAAVDFWEARVGNNSEW